MSSRSIGVTKVELSRLTMSWVIRSPSDSALRMSRARPVSSGHSPHQLVEQASRAQGVVPGLDEEVEEDPVLGDEGEAGHRAANLALPRGGTRVRRRRARAGSAARAA